MLIILWVIIFIKSFIVFSDYLKWSGNFNLNNIRKEEAQNLAAVSCKSTISLKLLGIQGIIVVPHLRTF